MCMSFLLHSKWNWRELGHRAKRRRARTDPGSSPISASSEPYSIGQNTAMILHLTLLSYETAVTGLTPWWFHDDYTRQSTRSTYHHAWHIGGTSSLKGPHGRQSKDAQQRVQFSEKRKEPKENIF